MFDKMGTDLVDVGSNKELIILLEETKAIAPLNLAIPEASSSGGR